MAVCMRVQVGVGADGETFDMIWRVFQTRILSHVFLTTLPRLAVSMRVRAGGAEVGTWILARGYDFEACSDTNPVPVVGS